MFSRPQRLLGQFRDFGVSGVGRTEAGNEMKPAIFAETYSVELCGSLCFFDGSGMCWQLVIMGNGAGSTPHL